VGGGREHPDAEHPSVTRLAASAHCRAEAPATSRRVRTLKRAWTRGTVTPSIASNTNNTAAVAPVSRAFDWTPAPDRPWFCPSIGSRRQKSMLTRAGQRKEVLPFLYRALRLA
jgi:hypothetical protein